MRTCVCLYVCRDRMRERERKRVRETESKRERERERVKVSDLISERKGRETREEGVKVGESVGMRVYRVCMREREPTETESRLINNGDNSITMRKRGEGVAGNGARYPPMSSTVCVAA